MTEAAYLHIYQEGDQNLTHQKHHGYSPAPTRPSNHTQVKTSVTSLKNEKKKKETAYTKGPQDNTLISVTSEFTSIISIVELAEFVICTANRINQRSNKLHAHIPQWEGEREKERGGEREKERETKYSNTLEGNTSIEGGGGGSGASDCPNNPDPKTDDCFIGVCAEDKGSFSLSDRCFPPKNNNTNYQSVNY